MDRRQGMASADYRAGVRDPGAKAALEGGSEEGAEGCGGQELSPALLLLSCWLLPGLVP